MRSAWIKVDLDRVTLRLWKLQGVWLTGSELRQWLIGRGFTWGGGAWYMCARLPCELEPDEIIESQLRFTEEGITFVERTQSRPSLPPLSPPNSRI
jgi:hypothetical protein